MNDQDRDLIAALAQGQLSAPVAADAVAHIETDPELAAEYAGQVIALQFLQSATPPVMTQTERSKLHTNLTEKLGLLPAAAPAPAVSKKRTQWWVPVFGFVAAAAVVAAFVIFPGSSPDAVQDVSAELPGETESVSQPSAVSPQTTTASTDAQDSSIVEESAGATAPPDADDGAFSVYETDTVALDELLNQANGADSPEGVRRQLSNMSFKSSVDLDPNEVNRCLNDLDTEIPDGVLEVLVIGADAENDQTIVHVGFDFGEGVEDGMSFVLETCELVEHSSPG
jgi:hypothetical protein